MFISADRPCNGSVQAIFNDRPQDGSVSQMKAFLFFYFLMYHFGYISLIYTTLKLLYISISY